MRAVRRFFRMLFYRVGIVESKGEAFKRLALHEDAYAVAKGKVLALKLAHEKQHDRLDLLRIQAASVHASHDELEKRLSSIADQL